jgi:hypothetical protein
VCCMGGVRVKALIVLRMSVVRCVVLEGEGCGKTSGRRCSGLLMAGALRMLPGKGTCCKWAG